MSRNVEHQNAIMAGMITAREWTDAVITLDADLQDDIECIPQMVKDFEAGNDIVYAKILDIELTKNRNITLHKIKVLANLISRDIYVYG